MNWFKKRPPEPEPEPEAKLDPEEHFAQIGFDPSVVWCVELLDPGMTYDEEVPPLLYGPHLDVINAMRILDIMLEALNQDLPETEQFKGRVRPICTGLKGKE